MTIATTERIPYLQASLIAHELLTMLLPVVERIEIAGSLRRKSNTVKGWKTAFVRGKLVQLGSTNEVPGAACDSPGVTSKG